MVKDLLALMMFCFVMAPCSAQDAAVMNYKQNVFYVGLPNPIKIVVAKTPCNDIWVLIDKGEIRKDESNGPCDYIVYVDTPGKVLLSVFSSNDDSVKGKMEFRVKPLPNPSVFVARKNGGEVRRAEMAAQIGVVADILGFDINTRCVVTKYTMIVLRGDQVVYCGTGEDAFFKGTVKEALQSLRSGDMVILSGVYCKVADGTTRHLAPVEFAITE